MINDKMVPVAAVIGICEGARYLNRQNDWTYRVESGLYDILTTEKDSFDSSRFRIDSIASLGVLQIGGTYDAFASALRDWLIHPEQGEPGRKCLVQIQVGTNRESAEAHIHLTYSGGLPEAITVPTKRTRIGRGCRAWDRLAAFAMCCSHDHEHLKLVFRFEG
jgi:hypothetical protein